MKLFLPPLVGRTLVPIAAEKPAVLRTATTKNANPAETGADHATPHKPAHPTILPPERESPTDNSALAHVLVLPQAHVKFRDLRWQYAVYELFHRGRVARLGHALNMAPITFSWMALATQIQPPLPHDIAAPAPIPMNGSLALAAGLMTYYFGLEKSVGAVLTPAVLAFFIGANAAATGLGDHALPAFLTLAIACSGMQAASHAFEDIPPPWSHRDRFLSWREWLKTAPPSKILLYPVMGLIGIPLEFWAGPRLLAVQAMKLLNRLGYRPELRAQATKMADELRTDIRKA